MLEDGAEVEVDARWYRATYPDAELAGLSAQDHWRLIGRYIGRPPRPAPAEPDRLVAELAATIASLPLRQAAAHAVAGSTTMPIIAAPPGLGTSSVAPVPARAALTVRAGDTEVAGARDERGLDRLRPLLQTFCAIHGLDASEVFRVEAVPVAAPDQSAWPPASAGLAWVAGPAFHQGPHRLGDLWLATSHGLCLSFGGLEGRGGDARVRLFQVDRRVASGSAGGIVLVGDQALAAEGPTFVEAALRNPFLPVLIELGEPDGVTIDLALLAFPSLLRGGAHQAEIVAQADGDGSLATLWSYTAARLHRLLTQGRALGPARIAVALEGATGSEPAFSGDVAEWFRLFGLAIEPADWAVPEDRERLGAMSCSPARSREDGPTLLLPADGLPTVAALTAALGRADGGEDEAGPGDEPEVAPHLVAERGTGRPRWAVTLPAGTGELWRLQGAGRATFPALRGGRPEAGLPLAVLLRDARPKGNLDLLLPTSADRPALAGPAAARVDRGVTCVVTAADVKRTRFLLGMLAAQVGVGRIRVAVRGGPDDQAALAEDLDRLFPSHHRWIEDAERLDAARLLEIGGGDELLLAEDRVLLHDPRTLSTLRAILAVERTATAACVTLHETTVLKQKVVQTESGGYFPSSVSFVFGPHLRFEAFDTLGALPAATYPVVANGPTATLVDPDALAAVGPRLEAPEVDAFEFGFAALAAGWRNLCTSTVRVGLEEARGRGDWMDPTAPGRLAPSRWEEILGRVALLRELR